MVPQVNYAHFGTEYWQFREPISLFVPPQATIKKCEGSEDFECSLSNLWTHMFPFHNVYFSHVMSVDGVITLTLYTGKIPGPGVRYSGRPCNDTYLPTYPWPSYIIACEHRRNLERLNCSRTLPMYILVINSVYFL
ncbi:hypothetical protein DFH06DRAFT_324522 [Mycena polygramma]|nr:hypothetical protein DFH06DRAFT_324522 [Mycena polygramma]